MFQDDERIILDQIDGKQVAEAILNKVDFAKVGPTYVAFRENARKSSQNWYLTESWKEALIDTIDNLYRHSTHTNSIEICLTYDYKSQQGLPHYENIGRLGICFEDAATKTTEIVPPLQASTLNTSYKDLEKRFLKKHNLKLNSKIIHTTFQAHQFLVLIKDNGTVEITKLFRGSELIKPESVNYKNFLKLTKSMSEWMLQNIKDNGRMTYLYRPSVGLENKKDYPLARQFMMTRCWFLVAKHYDEDFYWNAAKSNLKHNITNFIVDEEDYSFIRSTKEVYLGNSSFAGIALLEQDEHKDDEERLFKFTVSMQKDDGSFNCFYYPEKDEKLLEGNQNFAPGQTLLYWVKRLKKHPDKELEERIFKAFEYYSKWHLQKDHRDHSFVSWFTQAMAEFYKIKKDQRIYDFIIEMNIWLSQFQLWQNAKYADQMGSFRSDTEPQFKTHSTWTGVFLIGYVEAYILANENNDQENADRFKQIILRGIRSIMQLSFSDKTDYYYSIRNRRVIGGVRSSEYNNWVRVDNIEHALTAFLFIHEKLGEVFFSDTSLID